MTSREVEETAKLIRLETATRCLVHAMDAMPGDDLGQNAIACAMLEMRAALKALDECRIGAKFDTDAAMSEIIRMHTHLPPW